ncbi:MAG: maleylacetoacetate isomerase [bacterium]
MTDFILYSYWRSSAAYRVRIALNIKKIEYKLKPVHLLNAGGEQFTSEYSELNPQHLVPTLMHGNRALTQSLAIIEYLDEIIESPSLLPATSRERAWVRSLAQMVACDIHPLNNLRVMGQLKKNAGMDQEAVVKWMHHWMALGFTALEKMLSGSIITGPYCAGDLVTMADVCLIPQLYNAHRFELDLSAYPTLLAIEQECLKLEAFNKALPESQPDAGS